MYEMAATKPPALRTTSPIAADHVRHSPATRGHVAASRSIESKKIGGRTPPEKASRRMLRTVSGVLQDALEVASCRCCSAVTVAITHDGSRLTLEVHFGPPKYTFGPSRGRRFGRYDAVPTIGDG